MLSFKISILSKNGEVPNTTSLGVGGLPSIIFLLSSKDFFTLIKDSLILKPEYILVFLPSSFIRLEFISNGERTTTVPFD